jgi:hypothetical protein
LIAHCNGANWSITPYKQRFGVAVVSATGTFAIRTRSDRKPPFEATKSPESFSEITRF